MTEAIVSAVPERNGCVHHWLLESANGPTSRGRCKRCGRERDFINNPESVVQRP